MLKFGDRVRVKSGIDSWWYASGDIGIITNDSTYPIVAVKFDEPYRCGDGKWWVYADKLELISPAVPAGWTPADNPPDTARNVHVLLSSGREWYGWYNAMLKRWMTFNNDADVKQIRENGGKTMYGVLGESHKAKHGEVVAWREISAEPEPKPETRERWLVIPRESIKDWQMFSNEAAAIDAAKIAAKEYGCEVKIYHATEAYVLKPGEPEVVKIEVQQA